jgi:uncharacterized protein (DUF1501 family)
MKLRRRDFMRGGVAAFSLGLSGSELLTQMALAQGSANPQRDRNILVMIELNGGNDGINTVIPFTDPAYYRQRPTLAVPKTNVLEVGSNLGLHPSMTALKKLWEAGQMAVIHGCGYPNADQSHFRSMDIWQTGVPEKIETLGWLGRYLDRITEDDKNGLYGVAFQNDMPRAFRGERSQVPSVPSFEVYRFQTDERFPTDRSQQVQTFKKISSHVPIDVPYIGLVQRNILDAYTTAERLQSAGKYTGTVSYPNTGLAKGLKLVAEVVAKQFGTHLFHVSLGGFDTHASQSQQHARLLGELSGAISAFMQDMKNQGTADNILVVTFSEFGRRVGENGSSGTDHGESGPMIIVGGRVKGGFYGTLPSLTSLHDGNQKYTTDFRRVYATVLEDWLAADPAPILGNTYAPVPFL